MKKSLYIAILFAALLAACAPSITVHTDYDKNAEFSKYKTWTYSPETMNLPLNDLDRRRVLDNVAAQLGTKGLTKSESGDLLVDVRVTAKERKEATAYNTGGGYYGGYRYGGGMSTTNISVQTYVDGTLIISLIDASKKELIWQGTGIKELDTDATAQQREQNIAAAVAAILANYPPGSKKTY